MTKVGSQKNFLEKINSMEKNMQQAIKQVNNAATKICEQNDDWRKISGCQSPYHLELKINKLENEIKEWQQISGCKTPKTLGNQLDKLGVNTKKILKIEIDKQQQENYNLYCDWVKDNELFNIDNTYVSIYKIFRYCKQKIIEAYHYNPSDLKNLNEWHIIDFIKYLANNHIPDPDLTFPEVEQIAEETQILNNNFDIYDNNKEWYYNQDAKIQEIINKEMNK